MLTEEAKNSLFKTSAQFENRVREVLDIIGKENSEFQIDFNPHPQAFPDIAMGEYGVEVKFTLMIHGEALQIVFSKRNELIL